jgi:hypothetical protein
LVAWSARTGKEIEGLPEKKTADSTPKRIKPKPSGSLPDAEEELV